MDKLKNDDLVTVVTVKIPYINIAYVGKPSITLREEEVYKSGDKTFYVSGKRYKQEDYLKGNVLPTILDDRKTLIAPSEECVVEEYIKLAEKYIEDNISEGVKTLKRVISNLEGLSVGDVTVSDKR